MKKTLILLSLLYLTSCATQLTKKDLAKYWNRTACGEAPCEYMTPETVSPMVQVMELTNQLDAGAAILSRGTGNKCIIGMVNTGKSRFTTEEIIAFNKDHIAADFILYIHVAGTAIYDENFEYIGEGLPYEYYVAAFYIKSSRAVKCYDIFQGKAVQKEIKKNEKK